TPLITAAALAAASSVGRGVGGASPALTSRAAGPSATSFREVLGRLPQLPVVPPAGNEPPGKTVTPRPKRGHPLSEGLPQVKRALVVGAARYLKPIPSLACPTKDAEEFADFLEKQWHFPHGNITLLTDDPQQEKAWPVASNPGRAPDHRPTHRTVKSAVEELIRSTTPESEVVVYFSGHGLRTDNNDSFVAADADLRAVRKSCITEDEVKKPLEGLRLARALLIFDTCRNSVDDDRAAGARPARKDAGSYEIAWSPACAGLFSEPPLEAAGAP